jgi:hypothetical protein
VDINKERAKTALFAADEHAHWRMTLFDSIATSTRIFQALERRAQPMFIRNILDPRPQHNAEESIRDGDEGPDENGVDENINGIQKKPVPNASSQWSEQVNPELIVELNDSQRRAIDEIVSCKTRPIHLIQGPPGTGIPQKF